MKVKFSMELAAACGLETKGTGHEGTGREVVREREEGDLAACRCAALGLHGEQGWQPAIWRRNRVVQWSSIRVSTTIALQYQSPTSDLSPPAILKSER